jgi:hypothetical protein
MRRVVALWLVGSAFLLAFGVAPAAAGTRTNVTMTVTTTFDPDPDAFTATGLPGCESGWVTDGGSKVVFTRPTGVFGGFKVFDCGSGNGFVLRLDARFGGAGSTGTWAVVDGWGTFAGMSGSGKLSGAPINGGILDSYVGTVVR